MLRLRYRRFMPMFAISDMRQYTRCFIIYFAADTRHAPLPCLSAMSR